MRLFVAVEPSPSLLDALCETSALLRETVRGRFVATDSLHVTLAFLGEVPQTRVEDVCDALRLACNELRPFRTTLGPLGSFGRSTQAVLWQGFDQGKAQWEELAREVRRQLSFAGFDFDQKGFLPHVTLMRKASVVGGVLPMPCVQSGVVDTVTLFSSDLSGERPRYEPLSRVFL